MSEVSVLMANVGHLDTTASRATQAQTLGRGLRWHNRFLEATGLDGYEWHPLRDKLWADVIALSALGYFSEHASPIVTAHQSYNSRQSSWGMRQVLPPVRESLQTINAMQRHLRRRLDTVVYVEELEPEETFHNQVHMFGQLGSQPSPDVWQKYNIETIEDERRKLGELGVWYVPDLFHERRLAKDKQFRIPQSYTERYPVIAASAPSEVHVSVGRLDFEKVDPILAAQSYEEMLALADRNEKVWQHTELYYMLELIETNLPPTAPSPRLVIEIPAMALSGLNKEIAYGRIVNNLKSGYPSRR